jgi:hypothetical protein
MKLVKCSVFIFVFLIINCVAYAQQYNSDSWLSKPHGTVTVIPTFGERSSMLMATYSLFPDWEFTNALYTYNKDNNLNTDDGHSQSYYAKYMFYQNAAATGGASVKFGTGMFPGTIKGEDRTNDAFNTYWANFPVTIPFMSNKFSWDIMPGASVTRKYEKGKDEENNAWGFTYSTRLAWYVFNERWAVVGEVFGTEGDVYAKPEYKIGVRWEPNQHAAWAFTYGQEFNGTEGAGFEIGVMIFTPQFACFGPCKKY